jgi:hypothetical protein
MPFEVWANEERRSDQLMPDWYEWRLENWGTKWDVCEVEIDEDCLEYSDDKKVAWFSFRCWTAWAPPVPVWDSFMRWALRFRLIIRTRGACLRVSITTVRTSAGNQKRRQCDEV